MYYLSGGRKFTSFYDNKDDPRKNVTDSRPLKYFPPNSGAIFLCSRSWKIPVFGLSLPARIFNTISRKT